jgi:uncharacterized membrane protein YkoI
MPTSLSPLRLMAAAMAAIALALPADAVSRSDGDHEAARAALARGEVLPLSRIMAIVAQQSPGDILEVELDRENGVIVYEFKILTRAGKVYEVHVDARTGALIKDKNPKDASARR